ncbi:MAG TPA: hypothetical protein VF787_06145 [Thermoanaerobaculia bacterium]
MTRRLLLVLLILTGCRTADVAPLPHDDPDEAAAYFAAKREGTDDRFAAYAKARTAMRTLQRVASNAESTEPFGKWTFLGPGNVGGRTRVLIIDDARPNIMYAGGVSGGLWKSDTAGASWAPLGDDLANIAINALAIHPSNHDILFAGTGEGYFREEQRGTALPLRGDGIFVTRDAGATWTQLASTTGADFDYVNDLVVTPTHIYAATRTGVWRSNDEGATWTRTLATTVKGGCLDLAQRGGNFLFASCGTFEQATVYRNQNAQSDGAWESVLSEVNMGRTTLAIAPSNPSVIYALAASNEGGIYNQALLAVYRSTQNGDPGSWQAQITNKSPDYVATLLLTNVYGATNNVCRGSSQQNFYTTMGWYCNAIAVDPTNADRVWIGGVDAFRSDDGGRTWGIASYWWEREDYPTYLHADQHAIIFHPDYDGATNKQLFFANDGGLARTDDALAELAPKVVSSACNPSASQFRFTTLNNGYGVTQFYHGSVSPDGRTYVAGAQDNGTLMGTYDAGPNEWRRALGGDGSYNAIDPEIPTTVYGSSQVGNIYRSVNGGLGWKSVRSGLNDDFLFITPFVMDANATTRLWIAGRRMWRTNDRADSWTQVSAVLPAQVSAIAISPANSNIVLAGTNGGHIVRHDNATSPTLNASTQWSNRQPRAGFVSWIAFDPIDANTAYATYAGFGGEHVWRSTDAGVTWSPIGSNLPDIPVHSIAVDPTRRERLYLGTDLGVFVSLDSGATWAIENTGFANVVTETVIIGQGHYGPAVYAFTHGRGAWRAELVFPGPKRRSVR